MPEVSVIMPMKADSLNVVSWAVHAVRSVVNQSYRDWELIIVNDRSEADMSELKEYVGQLGDSRIRGASSKGAGVVAARNTAADMAEGKFLMPLDADDALPHNSLEIMLEHWPGDGIVYGDTLIFGQDFQRKYKSRKYNFAMLLEGLIMPVGSLHLKSDWEKIGGWHPDMEDGLEDWEYWIRMGENGVCGHYIPEVTYQYRRRTAGRYRNLKSAPDGYKKAYNTMRNLHVDIFNGRFPVGCCGGRRKAKSATTVRRPQPVSTASEPAPDSKYVSVRYVGGRKGAFQLIGRRSGDRYNVPGTDCLVVNLRTGKELVERSDAKMLTKLNRGRDFIIV